MFIREKKVKGIVYRSLVENHREGGKVRQRVLYTLGKRRKTLAECIARERRWLAEARMNPRHPERVEQQERLVAQLEQWERAVVSNCPDVETISATSHPIGHDEQPEQANSPDVGNVSWQKV
jgi:hypothetical protein